jgi:hypothetical protein
MLQKAFLSHDNLFCFKLQQFTGLARDVSSFLICFWQDEDLPMVLSNNNGANGFRTLFRSLFVMGHKL